MPNIRTPLISGVTDQVQVRSKNYLPSAYAVGKVFTGVTLPPNINLDTYLTPGVSRVGTYVNGPPVVSPGYLVIHAVNQDEEPTNSAGYPSVKGVSRYRQIYYPDSLTETTPYTRVGESNSTTGVITWSTWTTMGGNWVCEILTSNKTAIVNYMYHSFGNWTLTLPDPTQYVTGTRIGLTQWMGTGFVVYGTQSQITTADISEEGTNIGALQYIFQIVPDNNGTVGAKRWSLEVDNNISGTIDTVVDRFQDDINDINTTLGDLDKRLKEEITNRTNADTSIRNDFTAADAAMKTEYTTLINRKQRLMKYLSAQSNTTFVTNHNAPDVANNTAFFDYTATMISNGTVTLPTTYVVGSRVVLLISPGVTTTVRFNNISEAFTNSTTDLLVLDFQATWTSDSSTWTVLEVG